MVSTARFVERSSSICSSPSRRVPHAKRGFGVECCRRARLLPRTSFLAPIFALLLCLIAWPTGTLAKELAHFITARGDQLFDGDEPFRFVSFNVPNLLVVEDEFNFRKREPFRWPDEFEIEDALESIRQLGGRVVRTYVISVYRDGSEMGRTVHVLGPGEFNEEAFRTLDRVLQVANRKGIRVIIPLVDNWKWMGGIEQYAAFRNKPGEAFWSDRQLIADFKATIDFVINRKNTYTGIAYRDDKAIFGWETGNELDATPEWTREIAAYIKSLDKNHLVIDGRSLHGVPEWSLEDSNIDVITTHHYPHGNNDFVPAIREAKSKTRGKKPYFVGEFGFVPMENIAQVLDEVVGDDIAGALLWSLRFHRREGGFYWHMEVGTGRNIYKAFHWPGFPSGEKYEEQQVLGLARAAAFAIQGIDVAPIEAPSAPKLLPIERVSAISWQGAAGASSYRVERRGERERGWKAVGENVSDAAVQYQPLFNDATAVPGERYYYRVTARNTGGESRASNEVGPVLVRARTLVDECADFSRLQRVSKGVISTGENSRTTQEDCHRFAMLPRSELLYRVEGAISGLRVRSFVRDRTATLEFSASVDGKEFLPVEVARSLFAGNEGEYGYLTPVLYEGQIENARAQYVKVTLPASEQANAGDDGAPAEISRVEIEYDTIDNARKAKAERQSAPLNTSVFVGGAMAFMGDPVAAVDKAARLGNSRINVVVTILVDLNEDLTLKSFGQYKRRSRGYAPYTEAMRQQLINQLKRVFARAEERGMDIAILPHIDAGGAVQEWRNWIDFSPTKLYGGYSYETLMIDSIAAALAETTGENTEVELALAGEMGKSVFKYPEEYLKMAERIRSRGEAGAERAKRAESTAATRSAKQFEAGSRELAASNNVSIESPKRVQVANLKIGISLNHDQVAGESNPTFGDGGTVELTDEQRKGVQALIDRCDFVGMSFYRPVNVDVSPDDFVRGIDYFMSQLAQHGLEVSAGTELHFSEVGIGGAHDGKPTDEPEDAVKSPWEGSADPAQNPWSANASMRALRLRYHEALLEFLTKQPARWHVSGAFFWSMGSWDPQGMQHDEFADEKILKSVKAHNQRTEK